jgi:rare lipoprotein A
MSDPTHTQRSTPPVATVAAAAPPTTSTSTSATVTVPSAHPQAVEPKAGQGGRSASARHHAPPASATETTATPSAHPKVTGPASNTATPAKGALTIAQVRSALLALRQTQQRYQLQHVDTEGAVMSAASVPPGPWNTSISSFYGAPLFGHGVACGGILRPSTLGVANKTLPCGTKVLFEYGSRAIVVKVIDRGPYIAGRDWDLTAATAVALHFPGLGSIRWRLVK